jgi:hypothetical protein
MIPKGWNPFWEKIMRMQNVGSVVTQPRSIAL